MQIFKTVHGLLSSYAGLTALRTVLLLAAALAPTLWVSQAHAISLNTLISTNGSITQGDKRFDNFSASIDFQTGTVSPTSNAGIDVQGITVGTQLGLRFSGPFIASNTSGLSTLSYNIQYDVTALNPNFRIQGLQGALINSTVTGNADALLSIEALRPATSGESVASLLGVASATNVTPQSGVIGLTSNLGRIHVDQTFVLFSQGGTVITEGGPVAGTGSVTVGSIETRFSQVNIIPEPASLVLMASGLLGLGFVARRRGREQK